jgi:hypothetical protein
LEHREQNGSEGLQLLNYRHNQQRRMSRRRHCHLYRDWLKVVHQPNLKKSKPRHRGHKRLFRQKLWNFGQDQESF